MGDGAVTLNEIGRARKSLLRQLRQSQKTVDTALERLERFLKRVLARKRSLPTVNDLSAIGNLLKDVDAAVNQLVKAYGQVSRVWTP